jgi:hypothetical protein
MERKIGEVFEVDGVKVKCVPANSHGLCWGCYGYEKGIGYCDEEDEKIGLCKSLSRSDRTSVFFVPYDDTEELAIAAYESVMGDKNKDSFWRHIASAVRDKVSEQWAGEKKTLECDLSAMRINFASLKDEWEAALAERDALKAEVKTSKALYIKYQNVSEALRAEVERQKEIRENIVGLQTAKIERQSCEINEMRRQRDEARAELLPPQGMAQGLRQNFHGVQGHAFPVAPRRRNCHPKREQVARRASPFRPRGRGTGAVRVHVPMHGRGVEHCAERSERKMVRPCRPVGEGEVTP